MYDWQTNGGSGSNEIATLAEVAERLGLNRGARPDRTVLAALRRMERHTGRRLLVASGEGQGRRYLVRVRELEAALDGEDRVDVNSLADKIASAVQRIEARVEGVSLRLDAVVRRVDALERRAG